MTTISGLPDAAIPLDPAARVPVDLGGVTYDVAVSDLAKVSEVQAVLQSGSFPDRLDTAGTYFSTQGAGDPYGATQFPPVTSALSGYGPVYQATGQLYMASRGALSAGSIRVIEVEAEVKQVSVGGGEAPCVSVGLHSLKSDYTSTSGSAIVLSASSAALTAGQTIVVKWRFAAAAPAGGSAWADIATAAWLRAEVYANYKSDQTGFWTTSVAEILRLRISDVTDLAISSGPIANPTFTGPISIPGLLALSGIISPTQITAQQDNYNPSGLSGATVIRSSTDASRTVTGMQGGSAGRFMFVSNVGANPLVLANENSASTAANRFSFGIDRTLYPKRGALLIYDGTLSRWVDAVTLSKAAIATILAGADDEEFVTSAGLAGAAAWVAASGGEISGATITYVMTAGFNRKRTMVANETFAAPTGLVDGLTYGFKFKQDATGSRVPTLNAIFDFGAVGAPTFSTGANKADYVYGQYDAAESKLICSFHKAA